MRKEYFSILSCCLCLVWAGCNVNWDGAQERRDLEISLYLEFTKTNLESSALLNSMIEKGEFEKARQMLQMRIFLYLQELDQLSDPQFQSMLGAVPHPVSQEELEAEVSTALAVHYTEDVRKAGRRYASVPSDIQYIRESREFLDKMERLGLPRSNKSDGQESKGEAIEDSIGSGVEIVE